MWKRYLEREDSKIVGTERTKPCGMISEGGHCRLGRIDTVRGVGARPDDGSVDRLC